MGNRDGVAGRKPLVRRDGLTVEKRELFLDTLAATCCVRGAIAATGAHPSSFYALKRRDAQFGAEWVEALTIGYDAMEARLIAYVMDGGDDEPRADVQGKREESGGEGGENEVDAPVWRRPGTGLPMDRVPAWVQVGLLLLNRHRATIAGGKPGAKARRIATAEETDALLNKKLDQLARSLERKKGLPA